MILNYDLCNNIMVLFGLIVVEIKDWVFRIRFIIFFNFLVVVWGVILGGFIIVLLEWFILN